MNTTLTSLEEIIVVGIKVRTNRAIEKDHLTGKMFPLVKKYFHKILSQQIQSKTNPGTTICAFTDYESDQDGDFTYFIGEQVSTTKNVPEEFEVLKIPAQTYAKVTVGPGMMPQVRDDAWKYIENLPAEKLGGQRSFQTDFEIYDQRASDHSAIVFDLFISIAP